MPLAPLALPLISLAVALFIFSAAKSWDVTFGVLLEYLAQKADGYKINLRGLPDIHFGFLASWLRSANRLVRHALDAAIAFTSAPLVTLLRYMGQVFERPAAEAADLAADVLHTLIGLRRVVIPAMIAAKVAWIAPRLAALAHRLDSLAVRAPVHIVHEITHLATKATTTVIRQAVAIPRPRIGRLEREAESVGKRIRGLTSRLAPVALVAPVAFALGKLGLGWLRCSRVKRLGKQVCGMDESLLESFLTDALLIAGTISLVELARQLEPIVEDSAAVVQRFWHAA